MNAAFINGVCENDLQKIIIQMNKDAVSGHDCVTMNDLLTCV